MADEDQLKELIKYVSDHLQMPILGFGGGAEFVVGDPWFHDVAIGTQIPGWLYADGSVYNIADYPQLAAHYASHHGASNFYGGDGVTTFAVPDLRGEFLRGSGTNSHTNQGDGGAVGEHQDGTSTMVSFSDNMAMYIGRYDDQMSVRNPDYKESSGEYRYVNKTGGGDGNPDFGWFTSRPTNTSFPIYIKATIGHTYSTTEQPVGTDEDGNTIYEKTIKTIIPSNAEWNTIDTIQNLGYGWMERCLIKTSSTAWVSEHTISCKFDGTSVDILCSDQYRYGKNITLTICYAKIS
jgi:hypothetical protein